MMEDNLTLLSRKEENWAVCPDKMDVRLCLCFNAHEPVRGRKMLVCKYAGFPVHN